MPLSSLDLSSAAQVIDAFDRGAAACLACACRRAGGGGGSGGEVGSVEHVRAVAGDELIATGDLHDHPMHFAALVRLAKLNGDGDGGDASAGGGGPHITFHELIHSDRLVSDPGGGNERDMSYRVLARVAWLKARYPERVHALLANHELAQIAGQGVMKNGVNCVKAFNAGVEYVFGDDAGEVLRAIERFIAAMPLALRITPAPTAGCEPASGDDILCAHSLPDPDLMDRFDPGVLSRALTSDDYIPRRGSAHLMVWGRGQTDEQVEALAKQWGVRTFILGHEMAERGIAPVGSGRRAVILNSDHAAGAYCRLDLSGPITAEQVLASARPLAAEVQWE